MRSKEGTWWDQLQHLVVPWDEEFRKLVCFRAQRKSALVEEGYKGLIGLREQIRLARVEKK